MKCSNPHTRRPSQFATLAACLALLAAARPTPAQCTNQWTPGALPGVDGQIFATAVFDDGHGPSLYAAGRFAGAGGVALNNVARWDGAAWAPLGGGTNGLVRALTVFDDDGAGPHPPALYAAGKFTTAGGAPANRIAKWDGAAWSALGSGANADVCALVAFDAGAGPRLYAGGEFTQIGGLAATGFACWNGSGWSALTDWDGWVQTACTFDDGAGPALYVGGTFTVAAGVPAKYIAKYQGSWSAVGGGMDWWVFTLTPFTDAGGTHLYAGGWFKKAGGRTALHVARWNGASWSAVGAGLDQTVHSLVPFAGHGAPALYAGGKFLNSGGAETRYLARWDGAAWTEVDGGADQAVWSLSAFDAPGAGPLLAVGGCFNTAGRHVASGAAAWDGAAWAPLGAGGGLNRQPRAFLTYDDGNGPALYAAGDFQTAGGTSAAGIARFDGARWHAVGRGLNNYARALAVHDDGTGPALYVGGGFDRAGGRRVNGVAKWDGVAWQKLGSGMDGDVLALCSFDDGTGPKLFAGGAFLKAGGVSASGVARWDGAAWLNSGTLTFVYALIVYDAGTGPELYAGGGGVHRWTGSGWTVVGSGPSVRPTFVNAFLAHDDGAGRALYAGGDHSEPNTTTPFMGLMRWNGTSWAHVGGGLTGTLRGGVYALAEYDDGTGPVLWAGGDFTLAGTLPVARLAVWDGATWSAPGYFGGVGNHLAVHALGIGDGGGGVPALYVGGRFTTLDGAPLMNLAERSAAGPLVTEQPVGGVATAGASFAFSAAAAGVGTVEYQWRKAGVNLADDGRIVGAASPLLTISPLGYTDRGEYDVRVTDDCGNSYSAVAVLFMYGLPLAGDVNCDGQVDFGDIDPFIQALTDFAAWSSAYAGCPATNPDVNGDGLIDFGDITPLTELLGG